MFKCSLNIILTKFTVLYLLKEVNAKWFYLLLYYKVLSTVLLSTSPTPT